MQITLLGSATLLWSAVFSASPGKSIASLLFLTVQMGLLGALLVFSSGPLYAPHLTTTLPFGLIKRVVTGFDRLTFWNEDVFRAGTNLSGIAKTTP